MIQSELEKLCCESCKVVTEVAGFLSGELGKVSNAQIEAKSLNSLVSYVDKTAEEKLVKGLNQLLPAATFLTEEETVKTEAGEYQWIVDPLDGTTNFLHNLPCFAISVALRHKEKIILGIIYEVGRDECFYAWRNGGAYMNGKKIQVSKNDSIKDGLIATGFPIQGFEKLPNFLQTLNHFIRHTRGVRRWGAAAIDLAFVACGRFDAFYEYNLNAWDVAAGILLVQEAGGKVCDFRGGGDYLFGREIIASNAQVQEEVLEVVHKAFYE